MMNECPFCKSELKISELTCSKCGTILRGDFRGCDFCKLAEEDLNFIKVFLKSHGSIKEVEKELGISYPTVKNRLNQIISSLGIETKGSLNKEERLEILGRLEKGELTLQQALSLLERKK
jgi:hypothetical protein